MTLLRGLASRAKALLLTDADDVFEAMDRRKRRRFRQHPLRMHLLYLLGYATVAVALWRAAGARVALVIWGLPLLGLLLGVAIVVIRRWRRDQLSTQQPYVPNMATACSSATATTSTGSCSSTADRRGPTERRSSRD